MSSSDAAVWKIFPRVEKPTDILAQLDWTILRMLASHIDRCFDRSCVASTLFSCARRARRTARAKLATVLTHEEVWAMKRRSF
jgi:hypothetical protein